VRQLWPSSLSATGAALSLHCLGTVFKVWNKRKEAIVTAIAYALSRAVRSGAELEALKLVAILSGIGLLLSVISLTYGLDLSPGFF
jgi:hypothetical protein